MLIENYPFTISRPGDIARPYLPVKIINPESQSEINVYAYTDVDDMNFLTKNNRS
jgi:hypothetical protein